MQQKTAPGHGLRQLGRFALIEQFAFIHQQHVAALFCFVEVGGAPEDQHPVTRQLVHHLPQLAAGNRVHAHAGFIQQEHLRFAHQRAGQPQLLLHPAGKFARQPVGERAEGSKRQQTLEGFLPGFAGNAAQIGIQVQVFHYRQIFVQTKLLRHIAEYAVERRVVFDRIEAKHAGTAFIRLQQSRQHPHQRGFARAVRPHQPGHIAFLDRTVQRRDRRFSHSREAFDQIIELDNRIIHVVPRRLRSR